MTAGPEDSVQVHTCIITIKIISIIINLKSHDHDDHDPTGTVTGNLMAL